MKHLALMVGLLWLASCQCAPSIDSKGWHWLIDGQNISCWQPTEFGGPSEVRREAGALVLGKGNSGSNLVSGSTGGGSGAGARASPTAQLQQPSGGGGGGGGDGSYQKIRWVKGELLGKGAHGFVYQGLSGSGG